MSDAWLDHFRLPLWLARLICAGLPALVIIGLFGVAMPVACSKQATVNECVAYMQRNAPAPTTQAANIQGFDAAVARDRAIETACVRYADQHLLDIRAAK